MYPNNDRHTGVNDVQCAFSRITYNPNLVAMHSAMSHDTLTMHTGQTPGDNLSPSHWEQNALVRQQLAQKLLHDPNIIDKAAQFQHVVTLAEMSDGSSTYGCSNHGFQKQRAPCSKLSHDTEP
jgi:hypothetical protein